jgi:hypothetical protein
MISPHVFPRCPDEGRCWHQCESYCWRILNASPLGAENWPGYLTKQAQQAERDDQRRRDRA